ncbi:PDR/VanB family oxidoreductase [Nocardioides sp. QY071]|uniref:PDR/VanB family oxidoreductase n=1 Tax=Nocardioides sp. QY071 TaxID=3044187 RepID=UPI00249A9C54|nr:PDR/VanB family oxidoreductase [Nocardioides sp. QY071]WGY04392.1 PDR/VanB family oxidoreductase [Nocardioides sp. QY071]
MTNILFRVVDITEEAPGIRTLRMVRADGQSLKPYPAGSHIDVVGPTGVLRQYSLCMPPDDPESILIAVKKEAASRGGSAAIHEVAVGDHLKVSKPRNLLAIADDADRHVLVAGGIGITPLLSMAYELHSRGAAFELHYFARSREEAAFVDLLENRAEFRDRVSLHLGVPRTEQPTVLAAIAPRLTPSSHVYTCGPEGFMTQVGTAFATRVGEDHLHFENFVASEVDTTGDRPFTVELDTGETFDVPADRSILAVLEDNGIEVFKSCEEGVCGSCVSGLLEGSVEHRDNCLTATDRETQLALCVSRATSDRLLIELY